MRSVETTFEFLQPARPSQKNLGQERPLPAPSLPVQRTLIAPLIPARICPTLFR